MKYEVNQKKYQFSITKRYEGNVEGIMSLIQEMYNNKCEYHNEVITDETHIKNIIYSGLGISLTTEDLKYVINELTKGE